MLPQLPDVCCWGKTGPSSDAPRGLSLTQNFLTNYRDRLETMSEAESTALAIHEVYSAYYSELGGVGAAPAPQTRKPKTESSGSCGR
jgi:hypothetical protein